MAPMVLMLINLIIKRQFSLFIVPVGVTQSCITGECYSMHSLVHMNINIIAAISWPPPLISQHFLPRLLPFFNSLAVFVWIICMHGHQLYLHSIMHMCTVCARCTYMCMHVYIKTHNSVSCSQVQQVWEHGRQVCILQEPNCHFQASIT